MTATDDEDIETLAHARFLPGPDRVVTAPRSSDVSTRSGVYSAAVRPRRLIPVVLAGFVAMAACSSFSAEPEEPGKDGGADVVVGS